MPAAMGNDTRNDSPTGRRELVAASSGRVDAVLAATFPDLSRARLQRLIAGGNVSINGEAVRKSGQVQPGDTLCVDVPETPHEVAPMKFDLPVLYEDSWLIAIDKPAGLAVHGAPGDTGPGVALWMLQRLGDLAGSFDVERPGIVHRLDKDTSGVLLLAKTPAAQASLSAQFEARTTHKTYLAMTDGVPDRPRAVIDAGIARHPGDRTKMAIARHGREARTAYESLGDDGQHAFLLLRPETGRTHQIRVHLAAIAAPVLFDRVYGKGGDGRQMLHAWQLSIPHPAGGVLTVTAPIPSDFEAAVRSAGLERLALPYLLPTAPLLEDAPPSDEPPLGIE
ncbi:MAG: RluA family pseudouridine synthase [Tepidiformaceae bacterium]